MLELENTNVKALYRRAQAYINIPQAYINVPDLDLADIDIKKNP